MALTKVSTDGVKDDAITKTKIPANQIEASELADNAVDTAAIANNAVNSDKIATNAVNTTEIADTAVTLAKLEHGTSSNDGKFLRANNGADPTFETVTGTTINNNADNRVITGSGTANTLEGEANLTFTGGATGDATLTVHAEENNNASEAFLKLETSNDFAESVVTAHDSSGVGGSLKYNHGDNAWRFTTNGDSERMRINSSGNVGIGTTNPTDKLHVAGTALIGSNFYVNGNTYLGSGQGIYFDGQSNSQHFLDDYEEGTYTPTFVSTGASWAYNHQYGYYQKVGNTVHVSFYITLGSGTVLTGTTTNNLEIYVPFAATSATRYEAACCFSMIYKFNLNASSNQDIPLTGRLYSGRQGIELLAQFDDAGGYAYPAVKADQAGCGLAGSITYRVA